MYLYNKINIWLNASQTHLPLKPSLISYNLIHLLLHVYPCFQNFIKYAWSEVANWQLKGFCFITYWLHSSPELVLIKRELSIVCPWTVPQPSGKSDLYGEFYYGLFCFSVPNFVAAPTLFTVLIRVFIINYK